MKKINFNLSIFLLFSIFSNLSLAKLTTKISTFNLLSLNKLDYEKIDSGQLLLKKIFDYDHSWPSYIIIGKIFSTPIEAAAIFSAFSLQYKYVPNLIFAKAKQNDKNKPNIIDVSYILDLPWPIPDAKYTNQHRISKISKHTFLISWKQLKSTSADQAIGYVKFKKYKNQTLMIYKSYIKPSSNLAIIFKSKMQKDTLKNMVIIKNTINKWVKNKAENYKISIKKFKSILSDKIIY